MTLSVTLRAAGAGESAAASGGARSGLLGDASRSTGRVSSASRSPLASNEGEEPPMSPLVPLSDDEQPRARTSASAPNAPVTRPAEHMGGHHSRSPSPGPTVAVRAPTGVERDPGHLGHRQKAQNNGA